MKTEDLEIEIVDILDFIIPEWAVPALINNDFSGLTEEEIGKVESFVEKYGDTCSINGEHFFSWHNELETSDQCVTIWHLFR